MYIENKIFGKLWTEQPAMWQGYVHIDLVGWSHLGRGAGGTHFKKCSFNRLSSKFQWGSILVQNRWYFHIFFIFLLKTRYWKLFYWKREVIKFVRFVKQGCLKGSLDNNPLAYKASHSECPLHHLPTTFIPAF